MLMRLLKNNPLLWLFCVLMLVMIGSYVIFGLITPDSQPRTQPIGVVATANLTAEPQPIRPFAALDPGLTAALLRDNPITNPEGLSIVVPGVPPIGVYLPAERELPDSPLIVPTLALPADLTADQDIESAEAGIALLRQYAGSGCAPSGFPVNGILTQRYHAYHIGIDIGVPVSTPVLATQSGEVIFAGWNSVGYGYLVILQNGDYITYYAHLSNFNVKKGEAVGAGSIIAWSGSTGNSSGPHVHYETRINDVPVDPLTFEQRSLPTC